MDNVLEVYGVRDYKFGKEIRSEWTRIGVGFPNKDGSYTIKLHYMPTDTNISLNLKPQKERVLDEI